MRLLTAIIAIFATLWGGYWYLGTRAVETGLTEFLADAPSQGYAIGYSSLETRGFPNRFDTTLTDISLVHPASGIEWQAPFFQIFALSYKPNHVIAVWPDQQALRLPDAAFNIGSDDMRASVVVSPNTQLAIDRSRLSVEALRVRQEGYGDAPIEAAQRALDTERAFVATRQHPTTDHAHDLSIELTGITLSPDLREVVDSASTLPDRIKGATVDATLEFDDTLSLTATDARLTGITIRNAAVEWSNLSLSISGRLEADISGYAEGTLTLEAKNWRTVFQVLATAGLVDPVWEGALAPLAAADGSPDDLTTTLRYEQGIAYFGPLALGPAPRLN